MHGNVVVVAVTVVAPAGAGDIGVTVTGAPTGVTTDVLNIQTNGTVSTAALRFAASAASTPGDYSLQLQASQSGIALATTVITLTIISDPTCPDISVICQEWATRAAGSTEYSSGDWAAVQATGPANVFGCDDNIHAWASLHPNGVDWLDLDFSRTVVPTQVIIYESYGTSSIEKIELQDINGANHSIYTGNPGRVACPRKLTIDVTTIQTPVYRVRISVDQRSINDWNEIDAVQLIGWRK